MHKIKYETGNNFYESSGTRVVITKNEILVQFR